MYIILFNFYYKEKNQILQRLSQNSVLVSLSSEKYLSRLAQHIKKESEIFSRFFQDFSFPLLRLPRFRMAAGSAHGQSESCRNWIGEPDHFDNPAGCPQ